MSASILSPGNDRNQSDPFELDRLAEELESRELLHPTASLDDDDVEHELPLYVPLSHDNPHLTSSVFNVEEFLLSRSHTSLLDLRVELREYLSTLKEELVKLINDDYEAFISLSTDLRGEGIRLNRIKFPLGMLEQQIQESKNELCVIQEAIEEKLKNRAILREEKALLHLLLKISDSVSRLESFLHIEAPQQEETESSTMPRLNLQANGHDHTEEIPRDKLLSRVASEYTQLLYHTSKARNENCVFVDEIQPRIDRIHSTLSSDLDHLFGTTLIALTEGKQDAKRIDLEKSTRECLKTYDMLGLWRDAEDVLRREVVRTFVKKTIFLGGLNAPHSPIVPHTPFRSSHSFTFSPNSLPPRTPYTPYTSFALRPTPINSAYGSEKISSPYAHMLDESDDPLAIMYSQILRFVERDLTKIMKLAETESIPSTRETPVSPPSAPRTNGQRFDIMANVVWDELGRAIMDNLGTVIFAAGRPNEFRRNHELTQAFIRSLEFYAPSAESVESMRSHPTYALFERRWQLPVYFQMRWKEIVIKLEEALAVTRIESSAVTADNQFVTPQGAAVWTAVSACWSAEVFIPQLSHRFWRLSLQVLTRYKTWLDQSLMKPEAAAKKVATLPNDRGSTPSRSSTPRPSNPEPVEPSPSEESSLRQHAAAILDIRAIRVSVSTLWREEISMMLPEEQDMLIEGDVKPEDALQQALGSLTSLIVPLSAQIVAILTRQCCDALSPLKSFSSQFRDKSKPRANGPSPFVGHIFDPFRAFFGLGYTDGPGKGLKADYVESYAAQVFEGVCQKYVTHMGTIKLAEDSLRKLKKRPKQPSFSLFGNAGVKDDEDRREEERIRSQLLCDVDAFGKSAETLGVNVEDNGTFKYLHILVPGPESTAENS
ncbi:COG complex component [Mycena floridula]|nr:COG complex component [Mycena floridula]